MVGSRHGLWWGAPVVVAEARCVEFPRGLPALDVRGVGWILCSEMWRAALEFGERNMRGGEFVIVGMTICDLWVRLESG